MGKVSVSSIDELISELGGPAAASRALNSRPQIVCNWRKRGQIPSRLFIEHERALSVVGIAAPVTLWGFAPAMTAPLPKTRGSNAGVAAS